MKNITKQRIVYAASSSVCMASVVGYLSAMGNMELGKIGTGPGMTIAAVCIAIAGFSGRLSNEIRRRWDYDKANRVHQKQKAGADCRRQAC